ncbi:hypothetical protein B9Z55_013920 [Caenorhabditis nigoni]|nr:hypothetical protein B9Z55_013920 [Caenorhabditis nigoni]
MIVRSLTCLHYQIGRRKEQNKIEEVPGKFILIQMIFSVYIPDSSQRHIILVLMNPESIKTTTRVLHIKIQIQIVAKNMYQLQNRIFMKTITEMD